MVPKSPIHHTAEIASWTVEARQLRWTAAGTTEWGTAASPCRRTARGRAQPSLPQIFDIVKDGDSERRCSTSTPKPPRRSSQRSRRIPDLDLDRSDRTDRLARVYNDRFNNIVPRHSTART